MTALRIQSLRGSLVETVHDVNAVVCDTAGKVLASSGDVTGRTLMRSAAKPFQAMPLVSEGVADRFGWGGAELAVACASHNSERAQVEVVERMLHGIGLDASHLVCGPHRSLIKDLGHFVGNGDLPPLAPPSPLASNCSGKHTGMLALAVHRGWPHAGYHEPGHRVQAACRAGIAAACGLPEAELEAATDGCGVVCWALPLAAMAHGYARLAGATEGPARRIARAMVEHPHLIAGQRRLCTALMEAYPGQIVAKVGAGGVYGAGLTDPGLGIAVKVPDGNTWAAGVALVAILKDLGLLDEVDATLEGYVEPAIVNTRCDAVGRYRPVGRVAWN